RHAGDRSESEEGHVPEPRGGGRKAGEDERREGAAAREPVDDADQQGTPRKRPRAEVDVAGRSAVLVPIRPVRVNRGRARASLAYRPGDSAHAESQQHDRDPELEEVGYARRQSTLEGGEEHGHGKERERVPEAPEGAETEAAARGPLFGDERSDRSEMIGLAGVAHAEQGSEHRSRDRIHLPNPPALQRGRTTVQAARSTR